MKYSCNFTALYFTFWAFQYYHLEIQRGFSHEKDQKFLIGIQNPCSKDDFCIEINSWKISCFCKFRTETWISYRKRKFQLPKVTLKPVCLHLTSFTYFNRKINIYYTEKIGLFSQHRYNKESTRINNNYNEWNLNNFQTWICNITLFAWNNGPAIVL